MLQFVQQESGCRLEELSRWMDCSAGADAQREFAFSPGQAK